MNREEWFGISLGVFLVCLALLLKSCNPTEVTIAEEVAEDLIEYEAHQQFIRPETQLEKPQANYNDASLQIMYCGGKNKDWPKGFVNLRQYPKRKKIKHESID